MRRLSNYSLTIVLQLIFAVTLIGQALTGLAYENEQRKEHGPGLQALPESKPLAAPDSATGR